ncbi:MAG: alpha/beta hydrolase [Planctomycetes bacterium]|nr:alpha/beta hydrolase [Planctomycetota bacterium]
MLHQSLIIVCLAFALTVAVPCSAQDDAPPPKAAVIDIEPALGTFLGTLQAGPARLRLVFRIERGGGERGVGTMDSLDQGAMGIPVESIVLRADRSVTLRCSVVRGEFTGTLNADASEIDGTWAQGGQEFPLLLVRGEAPELKRPQEPKPPFPYRVIDAKIEQTTDRLTLAGTLTMPESTSPAPAVILITGSGPQDRDETLMGHKPFLVIADALTRAGVAVLRLDDRGVGGSTGSLETATTVDLARDTAAAIDWLSTQPGIDAKRIGLVGHSEGGMIAPMLATSRDDVAFMVLLAGPAQQGDALLVEQTGLLAAAGGADAAMVEVMCRTLADLIAQAKDPAVPQAELQGKLRGALLAKASELPEGLVEVFDRYPEMLSSPWMRAFLAYDPAPTLERVRCPTLALFGERDLQVSAASNEPLAQAALGKTGLGDRATIRVVPGVNHLFQPCTTGGVAEYAQIETTIDPATLKAMVEWIVTNSTR